MYNLQEIETDKEELRKAVLHARPFKPPYVKIKVFYGCNLKCEMCNHWRETREPPVSAERFKETITELAELGTKKIHISGGEPMLRPQIPEFVEHASSLGIRVTPPGGTAVLRLLDGRQRDAERYPLFVPVAR